MEAILGVFNCCARHHLIVGRDGTEQSEGELGFLKGFFGLGLGDDFFGDNLSAEEIAIENQLSLGPRAGRVSGGCDHPDRGHVNRNQTKGTDSADDIGHEKATQHEEQQIDDAHAENRHSLAISPLDAIYPAWCTQPGLRLFYCPCGQRSPNCPIPWVRPATVKPGLPPMRFPNPNFDSREPFGLSPQVAT